MKFQDGTMIIIILLLILFSPPSLSSLSNTFLGKCIFLFFIVFSAHHSCITPFLFAALYIYLNETSYENMSNKLQSRTTKLYKDYNSIYSIREKHCKQKGNKQQFVDAKGNVMSLEEIEKMYPNIMFDQDKGICKNPCDPSCDFVINN